MKQKHNYENKLQLRNEIEISNEIGIVKIETNKIQIQNINVQSKLEQKIAIGIKREQTKLDHCAIEIESAMDFLPCGVSGLEDDEKPKKLKTGKNDA